MSASKPHRAHVGYLVVHPGLRLLENDPDRSQLESAIQEVIDEARERLDLAGLEMVGVPNAMIVKGEAIALNDPFYSQTCAWGPSVGIFVEVHVRNPKTGEVIEPLTGSE